MDLIARGTSGYTKKKRDESMQHYLKRLTHLYLEDRNIDEIVSTYTVLIACFAILIFLDWSVHKTSCVHTQIVCVCLVHTILHIILYLGLEFLDVSCLYI